MNHQQLKILAKINSLEENDDAKNLIVTTPSVFGKWLTYLMPAFAEPRDSMKFSIVVTPTLSLKWNIMRSIKWISEMSHMKATSIDQFQRPFIKETILKCIKEKQCKVIFLSPEMIKKELLTSFLNEMHEYIKFFIIDEGQCFESIAKFRLDMIDFKELRKRYLDMCWIVFNSGSLQEESRTAEFFGIKSYERMFDEQMLSSNAKKIRIEKAKNGGTKYYADYIKAKITNKQQCGIIYCRERRNTKTIAAHLREKYKVEAFAFNPDIHDREQILANWIDGKFPIIVATMESFGYGIIKKSIRVIIHRDNPKSLVAYYNHITRGISHENSHRTYCLLPPRLKYEFDDDDEKFKNMFDSGTDQFNHLLMHFNRKQMTQKVTQNDVEELDKMFNKISTK